MRVVTTEMGSSAALCPPPLPLSDARDYGVTRSQSQAWRMGRAVAICRQIKYVSHTIAKTDAWSLMLHAGAFAVT